MVRKTTTTTATRPICEMCQEVVSVVLGRCFDCWCSIENYCQPCHSYTCLHARKMAQDKTEQRLRYKADRKAAAATRVFKPKLTMCELYATTRPQIGTSQSQCSQCGLIFSADGNCEKHKPYTRSPEDEGKRGRVAKRTECTHPKELGMVGIPRADGVLVWGFRSEDSRDELVKRMAKARAARGTKQ